MLAPALYDTLSLFPISTGYIVPPTRRVKSGERNVRTPELGRIPNKARDPDSFSQ